MRGRSTYDDCGGERGLGRYHQSAIRLALALGGVMIALSAQAGVPISGTPITKVDLTAAQFASNDTFYESLGRELVDIEIVERGGVERYSATWAAITGEVHSIILADATAWSAWLGSMDALNGRYLDIEVGYFGGNKRWTGLFYEDNDNYGGWIRTTNTDGQFQDLLQQYFTDGYSIVDFEAYEQPGSGMRFAGAWVRDPNQPPSVLYYNLESQQLANLLDLDDGYVLDYERYFHSGHNEYRYALILQPQRGGDQVVLFGMTESSLDTQNSNHSDGDTYLIDIEPRADGSSPRFGGIWGNNYKSLFEVAAIPADTNLEPGGNAIGRANGFEALGAGSIMGIWAKNRRTGQTIVKRADEPFYIASTAKIAIHIRLWKEFQDFANGLGGIDPNTTALFTNCADCRDSWYVDERPSPGFNSTDFGDPFALTRFDSAMMVRSDNAATSMLVDHSSWGMANQTVNLNQWLAGLDGISQEFFPVTSIHEVDRNILWQGQVEAFPNEEQYSGIPAWAWEPYFRRSGSALNRDFWCDLATVLSITCGGSDYPDYDADEGHERYYNMGLNSASPRAVGRLLMALANGDLLDASNTQQALAVMTEPTPFDDQLTPEVLSSVTIRRKGGTKGGASTPISDAAVVQMGPDDIVMVVLTKNNEDWGSTTSARAAAVRGYTGAIGADLIKQLGANLTTGSFGGSFAPEQVLTGEPFSAAVEVENEGGGDALAFEVRFYASTNDTITGADYLLDTIPVSGLAGNSEATVISNVSFPAGIPAGEYFIGWRIDPLNTVGEWDETTNDNRGFVSANKLTVIEPLFADGFESGDTSGWSGAIR